MYVCTKECTDMRINQVEHEKLHQPHTPEWITRMADMAELAVVFKVEPSKIDDWILQTLTANLEMAKDE